MYNLKDTRDWKIPLKRKSLANNINWENYLITCLYSLFDTRFYYHHQDVVEYPRNEVMQHMIKGDNIGLIVSRQQSQFGIWSLVNVTNKIIECCVISNKTREIKYVLPLYTYPDTENQQTNLFEEKTPNLSPKFLIAIKEKLGYIPTPEYWLKLVDL